ncbi:cell division cycle- protein [Lobosporangium transversale]|nr:cell division cycle- protein [Lobosporangium transversale]
MTLDSNKPKLGPCNKERRVELVKDVYHSTPCIDETAFKGSGRTSDASRRRDGGDQIKISELFKKRHQDTLFKPNKKAKTFLELSNVKSVNHFSQSARILHQRAKSPPSDNVEHTEPSEPRQQPQLNRPTLGLRPESTAKDGRSHSDPPPVSPFLARLRAVGSESSNDQDKSKLMPPPLGRARTFAGALGKGYLRPSSLTLRPSPFLALDSVHKSSNRTLSLSSKYNHIAGKRLDQPQNTLRQAILNTSFTTKKPLQSSLSQPHNNTTVCTSKDISADKQSYKGKLGITGNHSGSNSNPKDLDSSAISAKKSCAANINPIPLPLSTRRMAPYSLITRDRRSSTTSERTSLSQPIPDTMPFSFSDSENHEGTHEQNTLTSLSSSKSRSIEPATSNPLMSSTSSVVNTAALIPTAVCTSARATRPGLLRRHQTMISNRDEFMRTLEPSRSSRLSNTTLTRVGKKSLVFAPDGYVPDPSREDCQILPCADFISKPEDTTKRITPQTLVDVLDGKYKDKYDLLYIVDCRFPYEFEGGHIKSAVNVNTTDKLEELLLQPAITDKRVLLIFHCEFSCERGPRMARHLRNQDREANAMHYPAVFYPEVYVMQGGYSGFFKENKSYCWPEAYVEMNNMKHSKEFEQQMRVFSREFSRTASKGFLGTEIKKF